MWSRWFSIVNLFLSVLSCNCFLENDDNSTLSSTSVVDNTREDPEALPKKEALSFLRPTIVRPPDPRNWYDQTASFSDTDRMDTLQNPRYINPTPVNREFGSVPFGYRTIPLRRPSSYPTGTRIRHRKTGTDPAFDLHDRVFVDDDYNSKPSDHFTMVKQSPSLHSYEGGKTALEGSDLFRYVTPDEEERLQQFGEFRTVTDKDIFYVNGQTPEKGSLQEALKSLWRYKHLKKIPYKDSNDDDKIIANDDDKIIANDDDKNIVNDENDDKPTTLDDILILNVTLIDRKEEEKEKEEEGNEYYAYYVYDEANDIDRMDVESDFTYYDEHDVDAEGSVQEGGFVEFEYVDDEYEQGDDEYDYVEYVSSSPQNVEKKDTEDDSTLYKRQGLFGFSLFGGNKKNAKKKKKARPFPLLNQNDSEPLSEGPLLPTNGSSKETKNIRVRIKSSPSKKKKRIRMKITEIKDQSGSEPVYILPSKNAIYSDENFVQTSTENKLYGTPTPRPNKFGNSGHHYVNNHGGKKTKNYSTTFKKVHLNTGLGTPKDPSHGSRKNMNQGSSIFKVFKGTKNSDQGGFKPMKTSGYGGMKKGNNARPMPATYGIMPTPVYGVSANMGYGGAKRPDIKDSFGWSAMTQMSDNLPDLNKAITIMSFIAFSVFVANLGVNALANSSLGIQFGRNDPGLFSLNPEFNLDKMIKNLDVIFEEEENVNGTLVSTFQKVVDFITAVYSDLYEITRREMANVGDKISNFLERNFSDDDLPVGDISKGFLARKLEVGQPLDELDGFCYRRLLCLSHNLTMQYRKEDKRNQLLPFWTFGIGWLKEGKWNIVNLMENLRAELAGQSGRDCRKMFLNCDDKMAVDELAEKVKLELIKSEGDILLKDESEYTQNIENAELKTTTLQSSTLASIPLIK